MTNISSEKLTPSYFIEIKQEQQKIVIAKDIQQMDHAVEFALRLHQSSNTPHLIHVLHDDIIDVTFVRYGN